MPISQATSRQCADSRQARIARAINRFKCLFEGESAFGEVLALGFDAIPPLKEMLFERDPSGLHQIRCRTVEALAALKAFDVLAEFLRQERRAADPVERLGDEAVVSIAAQTIARLHEDWVYDLLRAVAGRYRLRGVLAGLGSFRREESIEIFIEALSEDHTRLAAQAVLRSFGKAARPALVATALNRGSDEYGESESHLRKRRSALALLLEIGISRRDWRNLRRLMEDDDHQIGILACEASIHAGTASDQMRASSRLDELKRSTDWFERERIARVQCRLDHGRASEHRS